MRAIDVDRKSPNIGCRITALGGAWLRAMTYCVAVKVDAGLVFCSDSRTNAGVDQLSTYSKMFTFGTEGERALVVLTAGNLATTQAVVGQLKRDIKQKAPVSLATVEHMADAAEYLGQLSTSQQRKHVNAAAGTSIDTSATLIIGGQIGTSSPKLYLVYPQGNFIGATDETPYLQIGEVKYGKPVLDRIIGPETSLEEAALCALVSMDSTMQSNATVGPPIEVLIYNKGSLRLDRYTSFAADDPYLMDLKVAWDNQIKEAFSELTRYNWDQVDQRVSAKSAEAD